MTNVRDTMKKIEDALADGSLDSSQVDSILSEAEKAWRELAIVLHNLYCDWGSDCSWETEDRHIETWNCTHHKNYVDASRQLVKYLGFAISAATTMLRDLAPALTILLRLRTAWGDKAYEVAKSIITGLPLPMVENENEGDRIVDEMMQL